MTNLPVYTYAPLSEDSPARASCRHRMGGCAGSGFRAERFVSKTGGVACPSCLATMLRRGNALLDVTSIPDEPYAIAEVVDAVADQGAALLSALEVALARDPEAADRLADLLAGDVDRESAGPLGRLVFG